MAANWIYKHAFKYRVKIVSPHVDLNQGGRYLNEPWSFPASDNKLFSRLSVVTLKQGKVRKRDKYAEFNQFVKEEYIKANISDAQVNNFQVGTYGKAFADSFVIYYIMLRQALIMGTNLTNGKAIVSNLK